MKEELKIAHLYEHVAEHATTKSHFSHHINNEFDIVKLHTHDNS